MATAFDFILKATKAKLGRDLVQIVSTAVQEGTASAKDDAIEQIKDRMRDEGVSNQELDKAAEIYQALSDFLTNTNFNPNLIALTKY